MRTTRAFCGLFILIVTAVSLHADSKNPADYPLRLHIFGRTETSFYHLHALDEAKGEGRANLFENGEPRGVDFSFDCSQKVKTSFGFETYPAKWKKPNQELVVLFPVFGKSNAYFTCTIKTRMKDYAYVRRNGQLESESPAQFKAWMAKHDYDPEHGKNVPVKLEREPAPASDPQQ